MCMQMFCKGRLRTYMKWACSKLIFNFSHFLQGGIKNENLTLALEPEAASMYCRYVPQCINSNGSTGSPVSLEKGTKYLIFDLGGN